MGGNLSEIASTFAGLVLLLIIAGLVHRWPKLGPALVVLIAFWFAAALVFWVIRGDLFRSSGLESSEDGCGYERVC